MEQLTGYSIYLAYADEILRGRGFDASSIFKAAGVADPSQIGFGERLPEEVLAASVLNDSRAVVARGFEWTDDASRISDLARQYDKIFSALVNDRVHNRIFETPATSNGDGMLPSPEEKGGPTPEEILEAQHCP